MLLSKPKEILTVSQNATLTGRHISLRPTRLHLSLLMVSLGVWIGAANYQVNVAYLICFWIVCFTGIAALLTRRQLLGLTIHIHEPSEIFAGNTASIGWYIHNPNKRERVFWWQSGDIQSASKTPTIDESWQRCELSEKGNSAEQIWHIPILKRGYYPKPLLLKFSTSAPFGLFTAECCIEWQTKALAYPAPLEHQDFGTQTLPDHKQPAQQASMQGDDLAYLKTHQTGTPMQHIAWKVFAKRGDLMDKVFDEPPPIKHSTIISYTDYPNNISRDKLASLLTYRVLQAELNKQPYTLQLHNLTIAPQNQQREKCLTALALI